MFARANQIADRLLPLSLSALAFVFLPMRLRGQSSWTEYQPGSLSAILVRERSWALAHTHGLQEVTIVSGARLGLRARVIYSGQSRPVSSARREVFRQWRSSVGLPSSVDTLFTTECLFREDTLQLWLPVQEAVRAHLTSELKAGDSLTILAAYVGARRTGHDFDWLLVVNEYEQGSSR
jgi:hypothetical protein